MSGDYSRKTFKSRNNYSGVLMQQGRVQLDADWNEQIEIGLRRQRAETVDTIGRAVVPMETPDGFRVALNAGQLSIFPGRMYVDGLLAENYGSGVNQFYHVLEEERGLAPMLYQDQPFFPNADMIAELPTSGQHIAYLDVWQRELTYVKQPELVEPAIGVDTTARWQTVWQVKVLQLDSQTGSNLACGDQNDDWDDLVAPSAARLSTSIVEPQEEDSVCLVPTEGGYRALENRLYRVEIHDGGNIDTATFKWARHNASVETSVLEVNGIELVVAQSRWDGDRRFSVDDWVEVTDDVREFAGLPGEMRRVTDVDFGANTITLSGALPPADFPTQAITNATLPDRHTRIKRWEQQNLVDLDTGLLPVTGAPLYLEDGIQIEFGLDPAANLSGEFHSSDYWLFSARSADASIEILDRAPPRGIHHHYARLAILNFPNNQDDCRSHWPPEFSEGCCSVTVGDGETSHGQFTSIEEAVNHLPEDGGKVCVLPGRYQENVNILDKRNVIISGCGDRSIVTSDEDSDSASVPIFRIVSGDGIRIESLSIEANSAGEGVLIDDAIRNQNIILNDLNIIAGGGCGVRCNTGDHITITNNHIRMRDESSEWPGIFVTADDVQILNNHVETQPSASLARSVAARLLSNAGRGGVQIGGTSERVKIAGNTIQRGRGDGITLGSLSLVDERDTVVRRILAMIRIADDCEPCSPPGMKIPPRFEIGDDGNPQPNPPTVVSAGHLYDIVIEGNKIENMGRNGIGVVGFFDLDQSDDFISVENLEISNNLIQGCLSSQLPAVDSELEDDIGYGGIALSDTLNLLIHHNQILDNGLSHIEPICGIYVLHGEGVDICDNRIINNGEKSNTNTERVREKRGARSGIHLVYAITPTVPLFPENKEQSFPRQNGVPAAKIHNNIVSHPVGRALTINALGPVSVTDNQLTSRGILAGQASAIASTVAILNLGVSNEFYQQLTSFSQMVRGQVNLTSLNARNRSATAEGVTFTRAGLDDFRVGRYLANGNVMFANNQVVLDEFDTKQNTALSAVAIMSLDDIAFHNNQCDYSLWGDFLLFPNYILAPSVRVSDNRFKESLYGAFISGVTFGLVNTTTGNQATHCLLVVGNPGLKIDADNIALADAIIPPVNFGNQSVTYCEIIKASVRESFNLGDRL